LNPSALESDTVLYRGGTGYDDAHLAGRPGCRSVSFWVHFGRRPLGLHDPAIRTWLGARAVHQLGAAPYERGL